MFKYFRKLGFFPDFDRKLVLKWNKFQSAKHLKQF